MTAATAPATTPYDNVAYPSSTFPQTYPDRLRLIAGLHGLEAPPIETARVLEIGGGDGFNLAVLAAAWPKAQFYNFDLSGEAVARGQALAQAAGLTNLRIEQGDIIEVAATIEPGSYDYVIAHGVYAWVPDVVRDAVMALAGRALSPQGVFFVSYNAMPGGHIRRIMRDMVLFQIEGVTGSEARIAAARAFLEDHARDREGDDAVVLAMRVQSRSMLERNDAVLFHDELGDCFSPQYLSDVAASARANGLEFLTDSGLNRLDDGFLPEDVEAEPGEETALVLRLAQADDFARMRFFRQCLFVKAGRNPARRPDLRALSGCIATAQFQPAEDGGIKVGEAEFKLRDEGLTARLLDLGDNWPIPQPVAALAQGDDQLEAICRLFKASLMKLSTAATPAAFAVSERPVASPLVRAQIALGHPVVTTLQFESLRIEDNVARTLLAALDGSRTLADLEPIWASTEHAEDIDLVRALAGCAARSLLVG